ncbi:MAG: prenyltransferase [Bacteroidales bacterium]|jgi:1,4-dihydroxy-2-naphthoate octaprenyltransferase|nr:prenyltransferase [Bacteroidales bacterium]
MSFSFWFKATRPWSLPASTMPVVLTAAYLFYVQQISEISVTWWLLPFVFVAVICYHLGLNMISDLNDFKMGVDTEQSLGYKSPLVKGEIGKERWKDIAFTILGAGTAIGLFLFGKTGYHLLWIGGIGLIAGYFYHIFKKYTLGDVLIFVIFGVLIVLGTFYVLTSELSLTAVFLSIPVGLITTAILHANYTRDIVHDLQAGVRTQASVVGLKNAKIEYALLIFGAYLAVVLLVGFKILPYLSLLVLLTFPIGLINVKTMFKVSKEHLEPILFLDEATAKLQLAFTLLLSLGIFITTLF